MRRKHGFTLVELLVVMAIISILAAIAIPNIQQWITKSRAVKAQQEIRNMEIAFTKMLGDAGRSNMSEFINQAALYDAVETDLSLADGATIADWDDEAFNLAVEYYTNVFYALLRAGRGALSDSSNVLTNEGDLLKADVVKQLGTTYMNDLGKDPWDGLYQMYPGPWSVNNGPIPFRRYLPADEQLPGDPPEVVIGDALSIGSATPGASSPLILTDPATGDDIELAGVPAPRGKQIYIWSKGGNLVSGQALFLHPNLGSYDPDAGASNYPAGQEPELMGGGDDINNWDTDATYMQFYN